MRRTGGALVVAGAGCLCAVAVGLGIGKPAAGSGLPTIEVDGVDSELSVAWLGETLLGEAAQPFIDEFGPDWVTKEIPRPTADVVIANLTGPITDRSEIWDPGRRSYRAAPAVAGALRRFGVDVASLANGHAMDRGPAGLTDTITHLGRAGIHAVGAGATASEARRPLLIRTKPGTLAVVAMADVSASATRTAPGPRRLTLENLQMGADTARRAGARWVVAFVSWGRGYEPVSPVQRQWAAAFAASGYDLVVGVGSHVGQPIELLERMPVVYSLGNFVYGTPGRNPAGGPGGRSLAVTTRFSEDGGVVVHATCLMTDNRVVSYRPRPCAAVEGEATLRKLHPAMEVVGGEGSLHVPPQPR